MAAMRIGIIGDFNPGLRPHVATNDALRHAAQALSIDVTPSWIPTPDLDLPHVEPILETYDGLWAAPCSPYESMEGALSGIRFAREHHWPFVGT